MNTYPASEKLVHLISYCLQREYVTIYEVMQYFQCCYKTASRLMQKVHDMQYEIGFITVELIEGDDGIYSEHKRIRIKLDKKYE
jgi:hypothetical protein